MIVFWIFFYTLYNKQKYMYVFYDYEFLKMKTKKRSLITKITWDKIQQFHWCFIFLKIKTETFITQTYTFTYTHKVRVCSARELLAP